MTAALQVNLSYCTWPMLVPKNVLVLRLIIIANVPKLSDPCGDGLWGGVVGDGDAE